MFGPKQQKPVEAVLKHQYCEESLVEYEQRRLKAKEARAIAGHARCFPAWTEKMLP